MRHPFQRKKNQRNTVVTPFQRELVRHLEVFKDTGGSISGRKASEFLGRSANHISLMLNDGFVPAGETIVDMALRLKLSEADASRLLRGGLETKADQRGRDGFWLQHALECIVKLEAKVAALSAAAEKVPSGTKDVGKTPARHRKAGRSKKRG